MKKNNVKKTILSLAFLLICLAFGYSYYSGGDIYLAMLSAQSTLNE
jgi:cell division protein FtsB